jgi:hypothetical protein
MILVVTCGFGRSPKFSPTTWLAFWLADLCDVDHMESRGVWCRTSVCSAKADTVGHSRGGEGRRAPGSLVSGVAQVVPGWPAERVRSSNDPDGSTGARAGGDPQISVMILLMTGSLW